MGIQVALEALPNYAIPSVEVGSSTDSTSNSGATATMSFSITFSNAATSGQQSMLSVVGASSCSGAQPMFDNTDGDVDCSVTRSEATGGATSEYREHIECAGRGTCNRKTGECKCFDGYEGVSCG